MLQYLKASVFRFTSLLGNLTVSIKHLFKTIVSSSVSPDKSTTPSTEPTVNVVGRSIIDEEDGIITLSFLRYRAESSEILIIDNLGQFSITTSSNPEKVNSDSVSLFTILSVLFGYLVGSLFILITEQFR